MMLQGADTLDALDAVHILQPQGCKGISATLVHSLQLLSPRGVCQTVMRSMRKWALGSAAMLPGLKFATSSATTASLHVKQATWNPSTG